jgi:predicted nucleic acid-binding protein
VKTFLVDASVWIAAADPDDPHREASGSFLRSGALGNFHLGALDLTLHETTNIAVTRWKSHLLANRLAIAINSNCSETTARIDSSKVDSIAKLAIEFGLTGYDAAYVAASRELNWELVSWDIADFVSKGLAVTPDVALDSL